MELISLIAVAILIFVVIGQNRKISDLRSDQDHLRHRLKDLIDFVEGHYRENDSGTSTAEEEPVSIDDQVEIPAEPEIAAADEEAAPGRPEDVIVPEPSGIRVLADLLLKNWIGILGTVILVLGFGFLGTYVAINLSEFGRFLLFLCSVALIAGGSYLLEHRFKLLNLALWLRSASGAILLFACIGSSGIPGFKWIDNPIAGLILLMLGVAANIAFGHASGRQVIASVHVFLSLLAISIAPAALLPFLVALAVVLYGLYLTYRKKWDIHFLIIISLFFLYHMIWHFQLGRPGRAALSPGDEAAALFSVTLVFLFSLLAHYRHVYSQKKFELIPFLTHFLNWVFFGNGLFLYRNLIPLKFLLLGAGAFMAYLIARRAKKLEIRWLFVTDALAANLLMILSLTALYPYGVTWFYISLIVLLETVLFLVITVMEKEILLTRIAYFLVPAAGTAAGISAFVLSFESGGHLVAAGTLSAVLLFTTALYALYSRRNAHFSEVDVKMSGSIAVFMPLQAAAVYALAGDWTYSFLTVVLLIPLLAVKDRNRNPSLAIAVKIIAPALVLFTLVSSYDYPGGIAAQILYFIPMTAVLISMAFFSRIIIPWNPGGIRTAAVQAEKASLQRSSSFGLFLLNIFLIAQCLFFFQERSDYFIGMLLFVLSIINLESGKAFPAIGIPQKRIAFIELILFLIVHFTVNRELKMYLLLDIQTVVLILYWVIRSAGDLTRENVFFRFIFRHILELLYLVAIALTAMEVEAQWHPVIWIALAVLSLFFSWTRRPDLSRIRLYSVFLSWAASFQLCFILGFDRGGWLSGAIVIALNTLYLVLFGHKARLDEFAEEGNFIILSRLAHNIHKNRNLWLFYPFFAAVALYIFFRFNRNIITLMFVLESLLIFLLSLKLRENTFRFISMAGIAGSLIRLVFFDLTNSATVLRALVFIGMGVVMVIMNALYSHVRAKGER
ncbi:hypothetical protein [Spirochaeta isovalerica]|uniref:Membrane protein (DUF2339) n=1 Tax=Spirochaeta isovalerica TaxID=150 RepID=A0A841R9G4_9SPIO|nr:hypothetical protein [Spirochaeta isovalerica]MBB6480001.1 hypothetical protein [Spirochaeta isovalerica]